MEHLMTWWVCVSRWCIQLFFYYIHYDRVFYSIIYASLSHCNIENRNCVNFQWIDFITKRDFFFALTKEPIFIERKRAKKDEKQIQN